MQAPYNDRWERTKRHLLRNFLVNPGFRLSPVPEEERSSPSSDSGSLPDLVVEPEPDRHDHPPEYYEGLERRMKRSYRKLFLSARSDDDGSSDFEVNRSMSSTFMSDTNTRKDTEAKIVAERAGFDRNRSISKKKQSTKSNNEIHEDVASENQGARSDDDGSSDFEVNRSMASTFMSDTNTRKDTEAKIVAERAGFDRNHSISKKKQSTKSNNEIHEDVASENQGARSDDDGSSDFEVNRSMASTFMSDTNTRKDTEAKIVAERAGFDRNHSISKKKQSTKSNNEIHEDVASENQGARSDDDGSSDFEVNRSMASTFMLDTSTRKDTEAKIVAERAGFDRNYSISKNKQSTKSNNEIHEDVASENQDEFIRRLSSQKSDVSEYDQDPETEIERLLTASEITRASIDSDTSVDTEKDEEDPSKLDTDEDDETEITGIQNTTIDWNKYGIDDDEDCFDNAIRRGEFTSKARKKLFITSSEESFDDLEPLAQSSAISIDEVEVMREATGSGVNESWHGEVVQDSPALAFEGQTDADKLENESSVSTEINASYEQEIEQATEEPHIDAIAKITEEFWSVSPIQVDIEEPKEPRGSKRRSDSEGGAIAKRRQRDVAIQTGLEENTTWEDIRTRFFEGSPLVYRLCGCPDHVCS